jgi:hypothetical protein
MRMGAGILAAAIGLVTLAALPADAFAQWMWKDDAGHTVISDQPPPTSVPESRILRTPSGHASGPAAPAPGADAAKPNSLADQDVEFKKRQKEMADASKKQQDEAAKNKLTQDHCQALRASLSTLQSGVRIARTDDQGQRYFVDDSQRQTESQKVQGDISADCK